MMKMEINVQREIYPYCIVWSPLPIITWLFPFIGHTGIGNSKGVIYDFAGPYTIGVGNFAFGAPTRYIQLNPEKCREMEWDKAVEGGCDVYSKRMHNLIFDNCHSHVSKCLNLMAYGAVLVYLVMLLIFTKFGSDNKRTYGMVDLALWCFFAGSFINLTGFVKTFLPFLVIVTVITIASIFI